MRRSWIVPRRALVTSFSTKRPQGFRLCDRGLDAVMLDQRAGKIRQHQVTMCPGAAELSASFDDGAWLLKTSWS
jgi:hypothetical protein